MKKLLYLFSFLLAVTFAACENGQPEGPSNPTGPSNPDEPSEPNKHENHEWVDLGLSVKWATCNVGANAPEEFGDYFAWGETQPKEVYDWSTYKWCNGSSETLTKYNNYKDKSVLDLEDDAAHVNWGGAWRMSTDDEQEELLLNCIWTLTWNGYIITSKINGNSIFWPLPGYRDGSDLKEVGSSGCYWSSSLSPYGYHFATSMGLDTWDGYAGYDYYRCLGRPVRPVLRE